MKRTERHHLKHNELATLASTARGLVEERGRDVLVAVVVGVVVLVAAGGWFGWRQYVSSRAHALLAEAVVVDSATVGPPRTPDSKELRFPTEHEKLQAAQTKFKAVADAYPSTDAGIFARYREAGLLLGMGNTDGAAKAYQDVVSRSGKDVYGQMARLGLAETQTRAGQFDPAIATFKELSDNKDALLPVDGILMQLGRAYLDAGKRTEAQQTFNRIVSEFPDSVFNADAKRQLENIKKS